MTDRLVAQRLEALSSDRPNAPDGAGTTGVASARTSRWGRRTLVFLLVLALVSTIAILGVRGVGRWLVVADPLDHASAIVVLTGDFPFRAIEAASLYAQGWAPGIWLQRATAPEREAALARLGFEVVGEEGSNRQVLQRLDVPPGAIRILDGKAQNTAEEMQLIGEELRRTGGERVILVTSKAHSRRVRATWRALMGGSSRAIVRHAKADPFDPLWWRHTRDALAVSRELFGLLNVWAGFPVQPDRSRP